MVTRLHLPHAIIVRLRALLIDVVILTPETAVTVGVLSSSPSLSVRFSTQEEAMDVSRSAPLGARFHADVILGILSKPYTNIPRASPTWYGMQDVLSTEA